MYIYVRGARKLSLDDPLGKHLALDILQDLHYFQGKDYSQQFRITHLLSHKSGLRDAVEEGSQESKKRGIMEDKDVSLHEELAGIKQTKTVFAPGEGRKSTRSSYLVYIFFAPSRWGK